VIERNVILQIMYLALKRNIIS